MRTLTLILIVLTLPACGSTTSGVEGDTQFFYDVCLFPCGVSQPMMTGTEENITITGDIPSVTVDTTNHAVAFVAGAVTRMCCSGSNCTGGNLFAQGTCPTGESTQLSLKVQARSAGTTMLTLTSGGATFDSVQLTVSDAATLVVTCTEKPVPASMTVTQDCALGWTARDSHNTQLMASSGVTFTSTDASVVAFQPPFSPVVGTVNASQDLFSWDLLAVGPGSATMTASAMSANVVVPIVVTP